MWTYSVDIIMSDIVLTAVLGGPHRLSLGAEVMFQRGGGMEAAMLSLGGAYRCEEWEATARLGLHAWHLTYLHKMKDLALVAECEGSLMQVGGEGEG